MERKVAIKAQVHVGSRGKSGGIKIASSPKEARSMNEDIIGMNLKGRLAEKAVEIDREFYAGINLDRDKNQSVLIVSSQGGANIEKIAEENPDIVAKKNIDYVYGLRNFETRNILYKSNIPKEIITEE